LDANAIKTPKKPLFERHAKEADKHKQSTSSFSSAIQKNPRYLQGTQQIDETVSIKNALLAVDHVPATIQTRFQELTIIIVRYIMVNSNCWLGLVI